MTGISENRYIGKNGYVQLSKQINGKRLRVLEHVYVWESVNGKKPEGHHIHHIDENPSNNDISNLMCVTEMTHKRLHCGWKLIDGEWWKPCGHCKKLLKATTDNFGRQKHNKCGIMYVCHSCDYKRVIVKRAKAKALKLSMTLYIRIDILEEEK